MGKEEQGYVKENNASSTESSSNNEVGTKTCHTKNMMIVIGTQ